MTEIIKKRKENTTLFNQISKLRNLLYTNLIIVLFSGTSCLKVSNNKINGTPNKPKENNNTIEFSGYTWHVKNSRGLVGPGPNYFSNNKKNVWVDTNGYLHLTIIKSNNTWQCAEVICKKPIGYGTYTFTIAAPKKKLDPNVVFGLFTWDTATYKKEANSEIDIEFSQWTDPNAPNLHYSVQPTCGTDEKSGIYRERTKAISTKYKRSSSIHEFTWTPNKVSFSSIWQNKEHDHSNYIAKWHFNKNNPLRRSSCGTELSDPIGIPAPGTNTEVRINLWLVDGNHDKKPDPPCSEQEIIIKNFIYQPLK